MLTQPGSPDPREDTMSSPTAAEATAESPPQAGGDSREIMAKMAEFLQLSSGGASAGASLDFLKDVPLTITARLGQTVLPIGEILKMGPGAVVELDRDISQPVDLAVRGMVFARGEVIVVEDHFAIRIKELLPPRGSKAKG